ncbi:leucine-rich repeat-containing protein 71-like isoform X2 [Dendronephthya gigantea]|uniref:leucine-rich repeat-containing protein 71-like isoform X2 n=1 Tax=Dendronephthya gigantea TaxID=151771 RepID=UPI00106B3E98|nr:leucine-rich repeat-containing protein 71-like isoform X2 [Dendronephthya gigantea]
MGKRGSVEKPSSTNITDKNINEVSNESFPDEGEGPYALTNNFAQDFHELAKRAGFPELRVVPRPCRPKSKKISSAGPESTQPPAKGDKKDDKKDDLKMDRTMSQSTNRSDVDRPPATFALKEKYEYFKPCVQAVWEVYEGTKSMAKEVYIRGWKIDNQIMEILSLTLPTQDKLVKIDFNNTGLTDHLLEVLANVMKHLPLLRSLSLDGNPVHLQSYGMFLPEESTLQNLSLRNCYVNDQGATRIGQALTSNKHLLTLNLCFNKISCEGVDSIARGLRTNRTLLCLDLGSNLIKDAGAIKLAEVISKFALNHEETVARRLLMSKKNVEEPAGTPSKSVSHGVGKSERPPSVRSGSHLGKDQKKDKQKGAKKESKKISVDDKPLKKASSTDASKDAKKGKKTSMVKVDRKGFSGVVDQDASDVVEFPNPLLEPVEEIKGQLYIPGNRALINLNVSANKIGEPGMKSLLHAVQYQSQLAVAQARHVGIGLLRLSIKRNDISDDNVVYQTLQELMITRDPFFKPDNASHDDAGSIKEME